MNTFPLLTLITVTPIVGGAVLMFLRADQRRFAKPIAIATALVSLCLVVFSWVQFEANTGALRLEERHVWISTLAVDYHLGIDGLGMVMLLLTAIVVPMAIGAAGHIHDRAPLYYGLVLLLQAGLYGTFTALNFFHWFLFWELSLVPAFFLVRLWGGPERTAAATRFFVYTMAGSVAMLLAFVAIYLCTGKFDFVDLTQLARDGDLTKALAQSHWHPFGLTMERAIFIGIFFGLAVKVPILPFHSWLPLTYAESPPSTTMLLTGVMSKMGLYGFLRILLPMFPEQFRVLLTPLMWLAVITIIYSAGAAFAQNDLRRLLAYSSINHLGYCVLAIAAAAGAGTAATPILDRIAALNGSMLQIFNHGLTAATLFWMVGLIEQRSGGLRHLHEFGGLRKSAPIFCGVMGIALFSYLGLPGLNGFIGEFLIFKGVFGLVPWAAALSLFGLLITAVFILTLIQRVFHGPLNPRWANWPDLSVRERIMLTGPIALMFVLGLYPELLLRLLNPASLEFVKGLPR